MPEAPERKARTGVALPVVLLVLVALILIGVLLWRGLGSTPREPARLASPSGASGAVEVPLETAAPPPSDPARIASAASGLEGPSAGSASAQTEAAPDPEIEDRFETPLALAAYRRGLEAQQRGDGAAALAAFREAARLEPENVFLLGDAGRRAWTLGRLDEAATFFESALAAEERRSGSDALEVADAMSQLAGVYAEQQRYADAEGLYEHALAIVEKSTGSREGALASARAHLGALYQRQGRNDEALALFESALVSSRSASAPEPAKTAAILSAMGTLYAEKGRYPEARAHLEEAVDLFERGLGSESPTVTRELIQLGRLTASQGSFEEAKPYYERAYAQESRLAEGGSRVVNDLVRRAFESYEKGEVDEARSILVFARERSEEFFGADHPNTDVLSAQLAAIEQRTQGR